MIRRAIDWFVPSSLLAAGMESPRRARAMIGFCLVGVVSSVIFTAAYWFTLAEDVRPYVAGITVVFFAITSAELLLGRYWWAAHAGGFTLFTNLALSLSVIAWFTGGAESPALWWYVALPMIGLSEWTHRRSIAAVLFGVVFLVGWHFLDTAGHPIGHELSHESRHVILFVAQIGLLVSVAMLTFGYELAKDSALRRLATTNEALEKAGEEAIAANKVKSAFLANMSHELRTPLTAILGFTEVTLERFKVGSQERNWLEIVRRNGQHMLQLVNDILDLSRIEADKLDLELSRSSPFELVAEVVSLMRVRADASKVALNVRFATPLPALIDTDPRRTRQILINLIGNAIKFTEAGSVTLNVSKVCTGGEQGIEFAVVDTGIGMTGEQMRGLFKPFAQVDVSTSRKYGGTGLGLAISQTLARKLGGEISSESEVGVGSTFRFSIPTGVGPEVEYVTQSNEAILDDVRPRVEAAASAIGSCASCRVLLAEDGRDNQILIAQLLRNAGATVEVVSNGQDAVEYALDAIQNDRPYDIVLMDIQMPVLDGHAATRTLRARGYTRRIVALTASAMAGDRERSLDAGCDDFLAKPIDKEALLAAVATCTPK